MEGVLNSLLHERDQCAARGRCGHMLRLVGERPKELITLVFPFIFVRAFYHFLHVCEAEAELVCS